MGDKTTQQLMDDFMRRISREIEHEMFYGIASPKEKLMTLLRKIGVKSARPAGVLEFESLEATLKSVTFEDTHLAKWPTKK